jgi:hypothetical protein
MTLNKLFPLFLFVLASCRNTNPARPTLANLHYLAAEKNAIVLSSFRCGCIDDDLNALDTALLNKFTVYGDSNSTHKTMPTIKINHISQAKLDTIAPDLYNMLVIVRKKDNTYEHNLITLEKSPKMAKILRDYLH